MMIRILCTATSCYTNLTQDGSKGASRSLRTSGVSGPGTKIMSENFFVLNGICDNSLTYWTVYGNGDDLILGNQSMGLFEQARFTCLSHGQQHLACRQGMCHSRFQRMFPKAFMKGHNLQKIN